MYSWVFICLIQWYLAGVKLPPPLGPAGNVWREALVVIHERAGTATNIWWMENRDAPNIPQ